jgi:hypothetical protein
MKLLNILVLLISVFLSARIFGADDGQAPKPEFVYDCKADREFMTTYEYLRSRQEFQLQPDQMRKISLKVTQGCTDSAAGFVAISELLLKARIDGRTAIETAQDVAASGSRKAEAFKSIFKLAFASEIFDLNALVALKMARRLSSEFDGDPEIAAKDFKSLAKFCVSDAGKGLSRAKCAEIIQNIIVASESVKASIADAFLSAFNYLVKEKNANLSAADALTIAERLASTSPDAFEVFKNSFEYAQDKSGLALSRSEAAKLAASIALNSKQLKSKIQQ